MAKRKKQSAKVQKRKGAKTRPKAKKLSKATRGKAAVKRAIARAKPKRAPVTARPVAPAVETVAVEVIEQPAPAAGAYWFRPRSLQPRECPQDWPGGKVRPSAFAVFKLITNSNLVGWMTGKSAGFSPLRIRPQ